MSAWDEAARGLDARSAAAVERAVARRAAMVADADMAAHARRDEFVVEVAADGTTRLTIA